MTENTIQMEQFKNQIYRQINGKLPMPQEVLKEIYTQTKHHLSLTTPETKQARQTFFQDLTEQNNKLQQQYITKTFYQHFEIFQSSVGHTKDFSAYFKAISMLKKRLSSELPNFEDKHRLLDDFVQQKLENFDQLYNLSQQEDHQRFTQQIEILEDSLNVYKKKIEDTQHQNSIYQQQIELKDITISDLHKKINQNQEVQDILYQTINSQPKYSAINNHQELQNELEDSIKRTEDGIKKNKQLQCAYEDLQEEYEEMKKELKIAYLQSKDYQLQILQMSQQFQKRTQSQEKALKQLQSDIKKTKDKNASLFQEFTQKEHQLQEMNQELMSFQREKTPRQSLAITIPQKLTQEPFETKSLSILQNFKTKFDQEKAKNSKKSQLLLRKSIDVNLANSLKLDSSLILNSPLSSRNHRGSLQDSITSLSNSFNQSQSFRSNRPDNNRQGQHMEPKDRLTQKNIHSLMANLNQKMLKTIENKIILKKNLI